MLGKRILLADDDQGVRDVVRFVLTLDAHTVVEAANGKQALALFQPTRFDLVITDYAMPEMNGQELASQIRLRAPGQRILMISGHLDVQLPNSGKVDRFLNKPFSLSELREAVAALLSGSA